jgi:hypothetical protein
MIGFESEETALRKLPEQLKKMSDDELRLIWKVRPEPRGTAGVRCGRPVHIRLEVRLKARLTPRGTPVKI